MKKTLFCLAVLLLIPLLLLTSCGGGEDDVTTPKAPEVLSDLSSYTIIYPYEPDTVMYREIRALQAAIKAETGVSLTMKEDFVGRGEEVPTGTKEILVGITNRPESTSQLLKREETGIHFENGRLVIAGGSPEATIEAIRLFIETYLHDGALYYPGEPDVVRAAYPYRNATVDGVPIYEFVLVRDTKNTALATFLQNRIADLTGYYLPTVLERDTNSAHKIYVGSRASGMAAPTAGQYRIEWKDGSLGLYGADSAGNHAAVVAFASAFAGSGETLALQYTTTTGAAEALSFYKLNLPSTYSDMTGKYELTYSADTVMDRFFAAKDSLPEEITVIDRISLDSYPTTAAAAVYVSPDGNDGAPGTKEEPLLTLAEAVNRIRAKASGVIWMMGGTYSFAETLTIDGTIKATAETPFFIKAYDGEEVVLTTNRELDTSADKWLPLDPSDNADVWNRIPEEARDSVIYTTLTAQGWTEKDIPDVQKATGPASLFVGGEEYTLARYPNKTDDINKLMYFTAAYDTGTVTSRDGSNLYWAWVDRAVAAGKDPKTWIVGWEIRVLNTYDNAGDKNSHADMGAEILSWVNTGDIWYFGSTFEGWEFGYYNLALETEGQYWAHTESGERWTPESGEVPYLGTPKGTAPDGKTPYYSLKSVQNNSFGAKVSGNSAAGRNTFYLFNAVEALDAPGEWFYDKQSGCIYLYPEEEHGALAEQTVAFSSSSAFALMTITGARYLVLDGLTFNGVSHRAINASKSSHIVVQDCFFGNTKYSGAYFGECTDTAVIYSEFTRAGESMLSFSNTTSSLNLIPCNNVVQNCLFYDALPMEETGATWSGYRMVVSHNYFNNTVLHGSRSVECIIEYNRFEGGSKDVTDGGMIYSGGSSSRGNHYRYNLIHMFNATHQAVYNDGMGSGNYMYYNVVSMLHSRSDHNNAWYSSTGWGNVSYANLTILRTPSEVVAAGGNGTIESEETYQSPLKGDAYSESALFYYYFGDEYSAGGVAARYQPVDYEGRSQKDFTVNAEGKVTFTTQPVLSQSLAGHWWVGNKTNETKDYMVTGDLEAWWRHAPEYANNLYGTQLILDLYAASTAGEEDYHPKYFYMPWYLTGKTYTYEGLPERVKLLIPEYSYLEKVGEDTYLRTVPAHVAERNEDGSVTLTYEEVAAMERSRRAPQYSAVTNNVILGGTPTYKIENNKYLVTGEVNRAEIITDSPAASKYRGYVPTSQKTNNFMYYYADDLVPFARSDFDYTVPDETWDFIFALAEDDPTMTLTAEAIEALSKVDYTKAGPTFYMDYEWWLYVVYPDF